MINPSSLFSRKQFLPDGIGCNEGTEKMIHSQCCHATFIFQNVVIMHLKKFKLFNILTGTCPDFKSLPPKAILTAVYRQFLNKSSAIGGYTADADAATSLSNSQTHN